MRLWQRLTEALKDKNNVWAAQLSHHNSFRNPDLEVAAIKATSYDRYCINCKNVQHVFQWVRTPPLYLKTLIWALAMRMQKTLPPSNAFSPSSPASVSLFPLQTPSSQPSPSSLSPSFSSLNWTPFTFSNIAWHHRQFFWDPLSSCQLPDESTGAREEEFFFFCMRTMNMGKRRGR
ncbi:hypothetical protein QN277_022572 [Acacia crassicarpa]|uniref:Uncharacterized protein n=1 Tax=Acacia crassicarpa TaxID=499986 RepID=A0AAE1JF81_9FABA|nr:hypothetical protein QN277_022572 [Acacia crassicarpa]